MLCVNHISVPSLETRIFSETRDMFLWIVTIIICTKKELWKIFKRPSIFFPSYWKMMAHSIYGPNFQSKWGPNISYRSAPAGPDQPRKIWWYHLWLSKIFDVLSRPWHQPPEMACASPHPDVKAHVHMHLAVLCYTRSIMIHYYVSNHVASYNMRLVADLQSCRNIDMLLIVLH